MSPPPFQWARLLGGIQDFTHMEGLDIDEAGNSYVGGFFAGSALDLGGITLTKQGAGNNGFLAKLDPAGQAVWAVQSVLSVPFRVYVDRSNHVFVAGVYADGHVFFDGTVLPSAGPQAVFLARFDPAGELEWVRTGGAEARCDVNGVGVDSANNCYLLGDFNSSQGTLAGLDYNYTLDTRQVPFLARFDSAGNPDWLIPVTVIDDGDFLDLAVNGQGDVYVTGMARTNLFDPSSGTNRSSPQVVLAKYDPAGELVWVTHAGERVPEQDRGNLGRFLALDGAGDVYLAGTYFSTNFYVGDILLTNAPASVGGVWWNGFVARYSPEGVVRWAKAMTGLFEEEANGIAVDGGGNVYVVGQFNSYQMSLGGLTLTNSYSGPFNLGEPDPFLICYDGEGTLQWAHQGYGSGDGVAVMVAANSKGEVVLSGALQDGLTRFGEFEVEHRPGSGPLFGVWGSFLARAAYPVPFLEAALTGQRLTLRWPAASGGYQLEWADPTTAPAVWSPQGDVPVVEGETHWITLETGSGSRLFRLRKP